MHTPFTTDTTHGADVRARNAMRLQLWADDGFAHRWLCHPGTECADGCDAAAEPGRAALYESELEGAR